MEDNERLKNDDDVEEVGEEEEGELTTESEELERKLLCEDVDGLEDANIELLEDDEEKL